MIVEWFLTVAAGFVGWIGDSIADVALPSWVTDGTTALYGFLESVAGLGAWFPWEVLLAVLTGLVAVFLGTAVVKLVLRVLSHLPFFGGSG